MNTLELDRIAKRYGDVEALSSVSLKIPENKFVTLLGPSGCGKTTTLNVIAGFIEADDGVVRMRGRDVTMEPPERRANSLVFQNYALFPHMTVARNVWYGLRAKKVPKTEGNRRINDVFGLLDLADLRDRYPSQLSGGQQQRVALARALVVQPDLLLLDEPLSNLDAKLRRQVRDQIRELQKRLGQTALLVTHDQEEALAMSDLIAVMHDGVIEQIDSPDTLWARPETVFVAGFMGVDNIVDSATSDIGKGLSERIHDVPPTTGSLHFGFRPEDVLLREQDGEDPLLGQCELPPMQVVSTAYLGGKMQYVCSTGSEDIMCHTGSGVRAFQPGARVMASVRPEHVLHLSGAAPSTVSV